MTISLKFKGQDNYNRKNIQDRQNRNLAATEEGVVVNSFIKNGFKTNIHIPQNTALPEDLYTQKDKIAKNPVSNPLIPLVIAPLAILGLSAAFTKLCHRSYKHLKLDTDRLPDIGINMNLKNESHFVTYVALQSPGTRTALGALAVFAFSSAVFMMKNFVDGFKDILVKKQEADIQRDLQENLIDVETRSFSGKNQIIRSMLAEKSQELCEILNYTSKYNKDSSNSFSSSNVFAKFKSQISFKNKVKNDKEHSKDWLYIVTGVGTLCTAALLAKYSYKNIKKTAIEIENYKAGVLKIVEDQLTKIKANDLDSCRNNLIENFSILSLKKDKVSEMLSKMNIPESEREKLLKEIIQKTSHYAVAPEALGGVKNKILYFFYNDDIQAHLYNWIIHPSPATKNLFYALTAVSGISYLGQKTVESVKEVQVKKVNANTELQLHDRLVQVELKNFLAKKNSAINPLIEEYKEYARKNPDNKEEIERMYNNILEEIKNGPPFVYA